MSRFIETIKIHNNLPVNIDIHNRRLNRTRKNFFPAEEEIDLLDHIPHDRISEGEKTWRCSFYYSREIEECRIVEYKMPVINSMVIIHDNSIDYSYKYADRSSLDLLYGRKGIHDDIIIVRNGLVTDSYFANLVFYDGEKWLTPGHPLLEGTKRDMLIAGGEILMEDIRVEDIGNFTHCSLVNAMLDIGDCIIPVSEIHNTE